MSRNAFHEGTDCRTYEFLGVHRTCGTENGFVFRVWAPRASGVSLVGDFNGWDIHCDPMQRLEDDDSIWERTVSGANVGDLYKFAVTSDDGKVQYKADPYAFESESGRLEDGGMRASRVCDLNEKFGWHDSAWLARRERMDTYSCPMSIYEVHLGSWRHHEDGSAYSYSELAKTLIPYVKAMGYTHIEILPVMEHPFDGSWGYQITGYYSVTARYGTPEGFRKLVDAAHAGGIGVILDWVPAHFPKDSFGLIEFDGHPLYEDSSPYRMEHKGWGTRAFDFGRPEVVSFLVSNAFFYCDMYHADGLRVDAVAAMLYLNYDRKDGEWEPNDEGGAENKEAVAFLQTVNRQILSDFRGVMMIAEESTAWPNVTKPPQIGGLGFNYKWNMGWMNDVLEYFVTDPLFRKGVHNKLTFSISYAYSENFILPISHDEVVHGKKSLLDKMPGEYEDKFAGMRSFLVYMFSHPGKKLMFMGSELAQFIEWDEKRELDWMLLDYDQHAAMKKFVKALNTCYRDTPALWRLDTSYDGFEWIDANNADDNVFTYYRTDGDSVSPQIIVTVLNLSGRDIERYDVGVPEAESYERLIDTDMKIYGGTGTRRARRYRVREGERNGHSQYVTVVLPKLSAVMLENRGSL